MTDSISAQIKLAAVERELRFRRRVYPRQIEKGSMTDGFAASQVLIFEAIAADYRAQAEKEKLI